MSPATSAAKKSAKKSAGHHDPLKSANDARRTFEHLGRIQAIATLTGSERDSLNLLSRRADEAFRAQHYKASADLLRAAEHLSFAAIHRDAKETVADDLRTAIVHEFEHLQERVQEHAEKHNAPQEVQTLMIRMTADARAALQNGSYRAALELARGAEALAHVDEAAAALGPGHEQTRLQR